MAKTCWSLRDRAERALAAQRVVRASASADLRTKAVRELVVEQRHVGRTLTEGGESLADAADRRDHLDVRYEREGGGHGFGEDVVIVDHEDGDRSVGRFSQRSLPALAIGSCTTKRAPRDPSATSMVPPCASITLRAM